MTKLWYKTKRATTVMEIDGMQACVYHQTPVVQWNDKHVILKSGGYRTATTKVRMNEVAHEYKLGFVVFQDKQEWCVRLPGCEGLDWVPFVEGMRFSR